MFWKWNNGLGVTRKKLRKEKRNLKSSRIKYNPEIIQASDLSLNPKDMVKFKDFSVFIKFHKKNFKDTPLIEFEKVLYLIMSDVVYYVTIPFEVKK